MFIFKNQVQYSSHLAYFTLKIKFYFALEFLDKKPYLCYFGLKRIKLSLFVFLSFGTNHFGFRFSFPNYIIIDLFLKKLMDFPLFRV